VKPVRKVIVVVLAVGAVLASCGDGQVQRSGADQIGYIEGDGAVTTIAPGEREPAPEFGGPLLGSDEEFRLADALGDVVVLSVWGSWCPPCRKEAPDFQQVWTEVADSGVQFVGINTRDPSEVDAVAFVDEFGITYPSVVDTDGRRMLAFRDTLPPAAIPTTLIIDSDGRLAARVLGAIGASTLRGLIEDVLAEDTLP
jgi:peroxiredoxin